MAGDASFHYSHDVTSWDSDPENGLDGDTTGKQKIRAASRFAFAFYYFVLDFFLFCIAISSFFYETHLTFLEENK